MTTELQSARDMLARARYHAEDFAREAQKFLDSDPYGIVKEPDADDPGFSIFKYKLVKPIPSNLNNIATDAIFNLRCALDHAAHAFADDTKHARTYGDFPFADLESELPGRNRKDGKSADIPPEIFAVMLKFGPFKSGDAELWALNKIANIYKHRIIKPMAVLNGQTEVQLKAQQLSGEGRLLNKWIDAENALELVRLRKGARMHVEGQVSTTVFFLMGDLPVFENRPVKDSLDLLATKVETILDAIEAEAIRLGLVAVPPITKQPMVVVPVTGIPAARQSP